MDANKKKPLWKRMNIESYPYAECREQHVWRPFDGALDHKAQVAYRVQKCAHCPTKKHSTFSLRKTDYGQLLESSRYSYPSDYRVQGGLDKADRGHIRMFNFLREITEINE